MPGKLDPETTDQRGVTAADGTTKARIERAAVMLFAQLGIDAVTTRAIAAGSGISEGAIYRYYPSKNALAEALFYALHHRLATDIRAASALPSITDQAQAIVTAYCRAADEDWALFAYHLLNAHRFLSDPNRTVERKENNPVVETERLIEAAMTRGDIPNSEPALKTAMALGVVMQTALHKVYGRITGDLSSHKSTLESAVLGILKR